MFPGCKQTHLLGVAADGGLDFKRIYVYNTYLRIAWDPRKADKNLRKHGIRFSDVEAVFFDAMAVTRDDPDSRSETRWVR